MKALCLCKVILRVAAENEKKWTDCGITVHGVIREIGYFFLLSPASLTQKWKNECERELSWREHDKPHQKKQSCVPGAALCPKKKKTVDSQINKSETLSTLLLPPLLLPVLKDLRRMDKPTRVTKDLDCMMEMHLNKNFIYIQKCIKMSMLGDNHVISIPLFL